jgi:hypothetical protein
MTNKKAISGKTKKEHLQQNKKKSIGGDSELLEG